MAKRQFTEEEIAFLRRNPYTAYVDENTLSFTVPFKIEYMRLHNEGVPPREILPRLGYPIEIIGKSRLVGISQKVRGEAESKLGFREPKHKKMAPLPDISPEVEAALTDRKMINRLQCEVAYLHQEIDFLKKNLCGTFCYLSTILDAYTRQILAYELSESLEVDFVLQTIVHMVDKHGISLQAETIVHSDQGFHYTSLKFIQILKDSNLRQSMSRRGNCWDNAPQESFFGHMKDEIDLYGCTHFSQVKRIIDDWMDYYNTERYQWQLAKLAPDEYYRYITTGVYPLSIKEPGPAE